MQVIDIYSTGDKHHATQDLDDKLGTITDTNQVIGHADQIQYHDGAEGESQRPHVVPDFGQHFRMSQYHIDSQQQGYGEKHYRLECDTTQPGYCTMMNLPLIGKVEQLLAESDQQNLGE